MDINIHTPQYKYYVNLNYTIICSSNNSNVLFITSPTNKSNRLNFPQIHVLYWKKTQHYGKVISRLKGWVKHWRWIISFFETSVCNQSLVIDLWEVWELEQLERFEGTFNQIHAKGSVLTFHQTKLKTINTITF